MKKLLLSLILLMFVVGNAFGGDLVNRSQGQRIYIPFTHGRALLPGGSIQDVTSRVTVRNYDGDARIEYIEFYDVDKITGEVLDPVKLDLIPGAPIDESFDLKPWSSWIWTTRDFFDPLDQYLTRAIPFVIIKWVSKNGNRITPPSFVSFLVITIDNDIKAVVGVETKILEELGYWH